MKKVFSFILTLALVISLGAGLSVSAATPAYKAGITGPLSAAPGQTLTFTVSITDIDALTGGLKSINLGIRFPANDMEFVSGSAASVALPSSDWVWDCNASGALSGSIRLSALAPAATSTAALNDNSIQFTFKLRALATLSVSANVTFDVLGGTAALTAYGDVNGSSNGFSVNLTPYKGTIPDAPVSMAEIGNSVYLKIIESGCEYSYDLLNWQTSPNFIGLNGGTTYYFYARKAATAVIAASDPSAPLKITLGSGPSGGVDTGDPTVQFKSETSITVTYKSGYSYSIDGANWQASNVFTNLTPNTKYVIYERNNTTMKIGFVIVYTDKYVAAVPSIPSLASKTSESVTLIPVFGCEYSMNGLTWQTSNVFEGLAPRTGYTFYARMAATETMEASAASAGLYVTTDAAAVVCPHSNTTETYTPPMCSESGIRKRTCDNCGEVISSEKYAPLGHSGAWREASAATCTVSGLREFYCTVCGEIIKTETIAATGHQHTNTKITKEATVDSEGIRQIYCTDCGATVREETIPKLSGVEKPAPSNKNTGLIILIIILIIVVIVAFAVVVLWMLSKNTKGKKRSNGRSGQQAPQKPRTRGGQTDDQWLGRQ